MAKSQPEIIRVITTTEELDQLMDREHKYAFLSLSRDCYFSNFLRS